MIKNGIYPTMITPYRDGKIDYKNVENLVNWYKKTGCNGIFAVCQSSEMSYLSLKERKELATFVVECANKELSIVVSGHCADSIEEQAEEINEISLCGCDAFVLVSNRLDLNNSGDKTWIENAEKLLDKINISLPLGIYECPKPYKRLLSYDILNWCKTKNRFKFIKDTCCDVDMLNQRLNQLKDSDIKLFNANSQTLLHTLKNGAAGYSGVMANFHPDLYSWLFNNFKKQPEKAQTVSDFLSLTAFTESMAYPCTAKYYLKYEGFDMDTFSRSCNSQALTQYQKHVLAQLYRQTEIYRNLIK